MTTRKPYIISKQWKKEHVWQFFGYCTADSQTNTDRHKLKQRLTCFFPLLIYKSFYLLAQIFHKVSKILPF